MGEIRMSNVAGVLRGFFRPRSKKGQTLVEYALIIAVLAIVMIGVFSFFGSRLVIIFSSITNILDTAQVPTAH
jgi:Flp pilus assembly pilin Flp